MKQDVLFEIGCEELPSGAVLPLGQALAENLLQALRAKGLAFKSMTFYATPRRLAVWIQSLDDTSPEEAVSRKGPSRVAGLNPQGEPTPALLGFAKSCGVEVSALSLKTTEQGEWYFFETLRPGLTAKAILPGLIQQALDALPIAKPMYWENKTGPFVRPVHWVVLLLGDKIIPATYYGIQTDKFTRGHRFHHPEACEVKHPKDYETLLETLQVVASFEKRKERIVEQIKVLAKEAVAVMPEVLIDEVTSIVEWPCALLAHFSKQFLEVPEEVLIASMQSHQKCFALRSTTGELLPQFITVANIDSKSPHQVIAGNEKVMQARLSDAAFFFEQDKKHGLAAFMQATENTLFQVKLGTLASQVKRMQTVLAAWAVPLALNPDEAKRALSLSKCDLMTGMVGEFPELQGIMGYHYALLAGETATVAKALEEQYLPRFAHDGLPGSRLGLALSLVNRFDVLVGIFGIEGKPSGVKDPFKLRRHALAVVRLLESLPESLSLTACIQSTLDAYPAGVLTGDVLREVKAFILERLPAYYVAQGIGSDVVLSVCAVASECLYDMARRIQAIHAQRPHLEALLGGAKRVTQMLKQNECVDANVDAQYFQEKAESDLFTALTEVEQDVAPYYENKSYDRILQRLGELRGHIDAFFDTVRINVDDALIQQNRLRLLRRLQQVLLGVADLSLLQPT